MDVVRAADSIDALIERRSGERSKANELEAIYRESARRHQEKKREQHRWEWIRFFERMADSHARMSADYQRRSEALLEEQGAAGGGG